MRYSSPEQNQLVSTSINIAPSNDSNSVQLTAAGHNWVFLQTKVGVDSAEQIIRGSAELIIIKVKVKECDVEKNSWNVGVSCRSVR